MLNANTTEPSNSVRMIMIVMLIELLRNILTENITSQTVIPPCKYCGILIQLSGEPNCSINLPLVKHMEGDSECVAFTDI